MIPTVIYETLSTDTALQQSGINPQRIFELQSLDERPFNDGYYIVINWQESTNVGLNFNGIQNTFQKSPRTMTLWVHSPLDQGRDYRIIDRILNRVDTLLLAMEQRKGSDNIRLTCVTKQGRSGNLIDDGWKTITRNATYAVLYDEYAA